MKKIKLIYIAGVDRSGSTLLGRILGEIPTALFVGEVKNTPASSRYGEQPCGCGKKLKECNVWAPTLSLIDNTKFGKWRRRRVRNMLFGTLDYQKSDMEEAAKIYRLLSKYSGRNIIVDSSKFPSYLELLNKLTTIDLCIVHITRDPRAVAYSWWNRPLHENKINKSIKTRSIETIRFENPIRSSIIWLLWNYIISRYSEDENYIHVKYEDLCDNPEKEVKKILNNFDIKKNINWHDGNTINLGKHHSVRGNPNQKEIGNVELKKRDSWKKNINPIIKYCVNMITSPVMSKFNYKW